MFDTLRKSCLAALATLAFAVAPAVAQTYPDKPVRLVVNFAAGGPLDTVARLIAEKAAIEFGQPVIVENRAGAGGNIGAEYVARAPADGYAVLVSLDHLLTVNPLIYARMSFDPSHDFVPAGTFGKTAVVLLTHPSLKARDFQAFVAKASSRELAYGSAGIASPGHLSFELLKARTGIQGTHVPYKGNAPALNDLLAGQISAAFFAPSNAIQYVQSGALTALAISSAGRNPQLPDVPTMAELGLKDFDIQFLQLVLLRAGTPQAVVRRWETLLQELLNDPDTRKRLEGMGLDASGGSAGETAAAIAQARARWADVVQRAHISLQ